MEKYGLVVLIILSANSVLITGDQQCEDSWRLFEDEVGSKNCFHVVKKAEPWQQAQEYCQRYIAHLVNLDPLGTFLYFNTSTGKEERLTEYIFEETNGEFWSGMLVRSGRLMWDSYGPEYILNKPVKSWIWKDGQPALPEGTVCGHVIQQRTAETSTTSSSSTGNNPIGNILPQNPTDTKEEVHDFKNIIQLSLCNTTLPFVCQKPVVETKVNEVSFCPEGWLGNLYIPYCFRIVTEPVTHLAARALCQETLGGGVFHAQHSTFNFTMAAAVLQYYLLNDEYFQNKTATSVWIEGGSDEIDEESAPDQCYVITVVTVDAEISQKVVDCETALPVMCAVPTQSAKPINIEVTSPFLDQDEVRAFKPFTKLPLTAVFDRAPNENEIIFIHTPTRYINSTMDYFQEISDDVSQKLGFTYNLTLSNKTFSPYEVNIWLPAAVKTKRKRRFARRRRRLQGQAGSITTLRIRSQQEVSGVRYKDGMMPEDDYAVAAQDIDCKKMADLLLRGFGTMERHVVQQLLYRGKRAFPFKKPDIPDNPDIPEDIIDDVLDIYDDLTGFGQAVDIDQLHLTTGYYSFGVYTLNPPAYIETKPVLVRYSERDWYIYIVTVDINTNIDFLDAQNITAFNLYADLFFVQQILDVASEMLNVPPVFNIDGLLTVPNFIRHYKAVPEYIDGLTVMFRVYLNMFSIGGLYLNFEQTMIPILIEYWTKTIPPSRFASVSVLARSTVACRRVKLDVNGTEVTFPSVRVGEISYSWERCYEVSGAFAFRECLGGYDDSARFGYITYSPRCEPFPVLDESDSTASLKAQAEIQLDGTNLKDVLSSTLALTDPSLTLTEADVIYVAEIVFNFWEFVVTIPDILTDIYRIVNNILERIPDLTDAAKRVSNIGNRIIESLEELTNNVPLPLQSSLRIVQKFLASEVRDQDGEGTLVIGFKLHQEEYKDTIDSNDLFTVEQPTDTDSSLTDTAIYFDEDILKDKETRTVFQIYGKTSLFNTVYSNRFELISKVAAASLKINGKQVTDLGNDTVTAVFKPLKEDNRTVCGYWDYRADQEGGAWRTGGCNMTVLPDKRITCRCHHLTNFAVLIDLEAHTISSTNKLVLKVVTKVGLSFSIVGLGLGIVTFVMFKKLRNGRGQKVLINLSVAMACSSVIFLLGMERTENKLVCKVVAALLHYFILVSFMWMLVEGVLQYLRFVKVLGTYIPNFMVKTMVPAWGIPAIPVVTIAILDHELYYGGNGYCWLARDAMIYGFIIPVAVILCANVGTFGAVFHNLLTRKSHKMASNQSERKLAFLHLQAAVSIFVVMGLTWVFGFLAIDGARITFHYVFAALNAFQGFLIFLLFTAREKQIVDTWKNMCCTPAVGRTSSNSGKNSGSKTKAVTSFFVKKPKDEVNGSISNGKSHDDPKFTNIDKASC